MKKAKLFMLAVAILGVTGAAMAFTAKGHILVYFGCGTDLKCDNAGFIMNAALSVSGTVHDGATGTGTTSCTKDSDCGSFRFITFL